MLTIDVKPITANELLRMGDIGRCELIYGELVMISPCGFDHGEIALRIGRLIGNFVEANQLGVVLASDTGFKLQSNPDLVRSPDASFVRKDRLLKSPWRRFYPGAPDLAVEVLSPEDTSREIAEKVNMWLNYGAISCWVADPRNMLLTIHRPERDPIQLGLSDTIEGEPALLGFVLPVSEIFNRQ